MLLKPKIIVIIIIITEIIFWRILFLNSPSTADLLTTHNKNKAITGNKIPFATWANFIISIGLTFKEENNTPINRIILQTILNFHF